MLRVLHFSDVHLQASLEGVPLRELVSKRFIGLMNLRLLRGRRFRQTREKLSGLARLAVEARVDLVISTGDHTALGTRPELAEARRLLEPFTKTRLGLITMPGNHDVYLPDAIRDGRFEHHFGDLLVTDLPDLSVDGPWPLVRLVTEDVVVVAVNSARPNPQPWLSSGRIPDRQLKALRETLSDARLAGRFVVVATHYAPRLWNGRPDHVRHGLENADDFLEVCARLERGMVVHGHVHRCFHVRVPGLGAPIFGAGSATDLGREGLWLFELGAGGGTATPGTWADGRYVLERNKEIVI